MTVEAPTEAQYKLVAGKRGCRSRGKFGEADHKLWPISGRRDELPDTPALLPAMEGTYATVAEAAGKLNDSQTQSGFLDYLYYPDPIGAQPSLPSDSGS